MAVAHRLNALGVLLVEPDPIDALLLARLLRDQWGPVDVVHEQHAAAASRRLEQDTVRVVILSAWSGELNALRMVIRKASPRPVIVLVPENSPDLVGAAVSAGAVFVGIRERLLEGYAERLVRAAACRAKAPTPRSLGMRCSAVPVIY